MKKHFFYVVLSIFALCCLVTLAGIIGLIHIEPDYLKALFGVTVLDICAANIALFRASRFFDDSLTNNLNEYKPSDAAARVMATLYGLQPKVPVGQVCEFGLSVNAGDFSRFLLGVAELTNLGLVNIQIGNSRLSCSLNAVGNQVAARLSPTFAKVGTYIS